MMAHDNPQQPLFGETRRQSKIINAVVAIVTTIVVALTILMAFVSHLIINRKFALDFIGYAFCFIILLQLVPQMFVVTWYRRGELEPKFRRMIYYNAILTILLCITVNLYFFDCVFKGDCEECSSPNTTKTMVTHTARLTSPH